MPAAPLGRYGRSGIVARLVAVALLVALIVGACGGDDDVSGFEADPGPIAVDLIGALPDGADPDAVPALQRQFLDWCIKGGQDRLPEIPTVQREGLVSVCGCVYEGLVEHSFAVAQDATPDGADPDPEQLAKRAFDAFRELDEDARIDASLPDDIGEIARRCIRAEAGL
jgi:hypothetical protein